MKRSRMTRVLAILLCVAMLATVTPIFAAAATVITEIAITDADVTAYIGDKAGDHLAYTLSENCHFTVDEHFWWDDTNGGGFSATDTFEAGIRYSMGWWLIADEGYVFAEKPTITINGETEIDWYNTYRGDNAENKFYVWTKPAEAVEKPADIEITEIAITDADVTAYIGEKAGDHLAYTLPDDCHFTVYLHYWNNENSGANLDLNDTFAEGTIYDVGWVLKADKGYVFAENPTITINGQTDILNDVYTRINGGDNTIFSVWTKATEAVEKPEPIETTVDLRIGDKEFYGVKGGETLVVESLDAMQDITVLAQNGVDIEGMSNDWSMSTKFLDGEGRGVLEVQVFEEGDDYVTFNLQSHYADCPGASVDDFQIMMITVKVEASAEKLLGDANGDGSVDMKDVLAIRKSIANMAVTIDGDAADVNGDNSVDMKDVLMIRKYIAKLIDKLGA